MALPQGINFRSTSGYVTDGTNEAAALLATTYPTTTAQGNDVGWEATTGLNVRDRQTTFGAKLAGVHYIVSAYYPIVFRIDLPSSGRYAIRVAEGEYSGAGGRYARFRLLDNTTQLSVIGIIDYANGYAVDADGTTLAYADWESQNTAVEFDFSTAIFRFEHGYSDATKAYHLAHLWIEAVSGGGGESRWRAAFAVQTNQGIG